MKNSPRPLPLFVAFSLILSATPQAALAQAAARAAAPAARTGGVVVTLPTLSFSSTLTGPSGAYGNILHAPGLGLPTPSAAVAPHSVVTPTAYAPTASAPAPVTARLLAVEGPAAIDSARRGAQPARDASSDSRLSAVFDGMRLQTSASGIHGAAGTVASAPSGAIRTLAPARPAAKSDAHAAFVPATIIVAKLEKAARTDAEQGYAQAVSLLADRDDARRELKFAALRVLAALPIARTLPYYTQALTNAAADEKTKTWGVGSPALWYIQRAILLRLSGEPETLKASPEAMEAVKLSYQDGNHSVRLAAAQALKNAGVEPGPERDGSLEAEKAAEPEVAATSPDDGKPGLLTRLGKLSPWKKWLLGTIAAATIGLGIAGHFATPVYQAPATPPAIVKVQPAAPAPAVPAKIAPPAKAPVKAPSPVKAPVKVLTPEQESLARIARASEDSSYRIKELGEKLTAQPTENNGPASALMQFAGLIMGFFLIQSLLKYLIARKTGGGSNPTDDINKKGKSIHTKTLPGENSTRFTDVEGMDENLIETTEIVEFLRNPEKFRRMGAHIPRGVLMDGPPGTGKTLTAKALAGEAGVPFFSLSGADFQEMLVGVGSARVRDLMAEARKEKSAIIFIDEIDAIGQARGGVNANPEQESTLNAILTAMNGFNDSDGIVFIGATNRADLLDKALTRPGRFDRKVHVGLPHMGGREAILAIHAAKSRLSPQLDLQYVARRTTGLAGADLANIINDAAILAVRRGADSIEAQDIDRAVDKATFGDERRLPVPDAIKRRVAYHEAGHVLASLLNEDPALRERVNKFTMVPHSNGSLGLAEFSSADSFMYTKAQLEAKIDTAMGGLVAERLIYGSALPIPGEWSTGPGNDLEQATSIAREMVQGLGMGEKTGLAVTKANQYGQSPFGDMVQAQALKEINRILDASLKRVTARLTRNRHVLEALTQAVLEKETIIGDEIAEIIAAAGPAAPEAK